MTPAMIPVVPMPIGQAELPHRGHMLFSARAPAKMDHHPAKRMMPDEMSFLKIDDFADGALDGAAARTVPSECNESYVFISLP
jgi:hypothetical protein